MPHNSFVHLTREEHEELGREVALTCRRMQEIATLLLQVYGPGNMTAFSAAKARDAMLRFYRDLAFQAEADLPGVKIDGYQQK
ncbi:MAG TPA: hypothetical protein VG672_23065 [Bryobacteraceae bacterium]|jgi:hypothetical protein|nr:hypothetical protein [Bryobacteraceae bacterium]